MSTSLIRRCLGVRFEGARILGRGWSVRDDFAALARAYGYAGVRITRTAEFEAELLAALERKQGTLIEVMLDPEVITTRGTLSGIREAALKQK